MPAIDFTEDVKVDFTPDTAIEFKPDQEQHPVSTASDFSPESDYVPPSIQSLKDFLASTVKPFVSIPKFPEITPAPITAGPIEKALTPVAQAGAGVVNAAIQGVEAIETPATLGLGAVSAIPVVGKPLAIAAGVGFGADAAISGSREFYDAVKQGDVQGAAQALGKITIGSLLVGGGLKTATAPAAVEAIAPSSSAALKEVAPIAKEAAIAAELPPGALFQGVRPGNLKSEQGKSSYLTDDLSLASAFDKRIGEEGAGRIDVYDPSKLPFALSDLLEKEKSKPGSNVYSFTGLDKVSPIGQMVKEGDTYVFKPSEGDLFRPGPGAQTAGTELPEGSNLEQLTAALKSRTPEEKASAPAERISAFEDVADKATEAKDAISNTLARVKAAGAGILDSYLHLPKVTNFLRSIGEWDLAIGKSDLATQRFVKQINEDIPRDSGRQEAITNWIQADGDETVLAQRAAASKGRAKLGYEAAMNLSESDKTTARQISTYLDSKLQEGMDAGILRSGLDNYVTQVWKRPNPVATKLFGDLVGGKLSTNFRFARQRIFDSYFEGEQAGFKPVTKDIGGLVAIYDQAFNKTLAARAFVKSLSEGKAEDGKPMVELSGSGTKVPEGESPAEAYLIRPRTKPKDAITENGRPYVRLEHSALKDWKYLTSTEQGQPIIEQSDMLVHPDIADHLNNVLKRSAFRENPYSSALLKGQSFLKATKLSLSLFHQVQEGIHAVFHRINPFHPPDIDLNNPVDAGLVRSGVVPVNYDAFSAYSEGLASRGGLVEKLPLGIGKLQKMYSEYLFQDYIPRLKMSMARHALERNMARYSDQIKSGKITEEQVYSLTADQANAPFGELNYKKLGRDPTVQDFFRIIALAPDFFEGRLRFVGQALKPYGAEQRVALGLMAATLYTGSRILNQILDNDPHWDKPFSVFHNKKEYGIRTLLGDVQHAFTDPRSFFYNRFSPFTRIFAEMSTGRNDKGIRRSSYEQLADVAKWLIPIPLDVGGKQTSLTAQLLQSAGGRQSPAMARFEVGKLARQFTKEAGLETTYDRAGIQIESDYAKLQRALEADDTKGAQEEYQKLLKGSPGIRPKTARQIAERFSQIHHPFTGSNSTERKFVASLTDKQKKVYQEAVQERVDLRDKFTKMQKGK